MRCNMEEQALGKGKVPPGTAFIPTPVDDNIVNLSVMRNDIANLQLH